MKKILVCNQKMFLSYDEALQLKQKMLNIDFNEIKLIICPEYINLNVFKDFPNSSLGAQDCHYEDDGPYTSYVSPYHLSLQGSKYCLVGHSETRDKCSDNEINKKVKAILKNSMIPIICIGETKIEKEMMKTSEVLRRQLHNALKDVDIDNTQQIIIAYEPRWMIGSGKQPSKEKIEDIIKYINKIVNEMGIINYKVLYGGSITATDINSLISDYIDGYLLGNSCVNTNELNTIVKCINGVKFSK